MKTLLLVVLQLAASGADAYYTHRLVNPPAMAAPVHEANPLVRPFLHSTRAEVGYFSTSAGLKITIPVLLRHHHHNKLAAAVTAWGIGDNAVAATYTATHPH